jgi:hypothetical protein
MFQKQLTSVPILNVTLTSSYLGSVGGMIACIDATPTSLLLFQIKDGPVITAKTHEPSLLLPNVHNDSAITMAAHTNVVLQLIVVSARKALNA